VISKWFASWIAILSGLISSGLALRVAFDLGVPERIDPFSPGPDLAMQSKLAGVAALAALVSVIAQLIDKASK
jgi:hypothetical protein